MKMVPANAHLKGLLLFLASVIVAMDAYAQPGSAQPARFALLIGVTDYRPSGYNPDANPEAVMFGNLKTPCQDISRLASRLKVLGWKSENDPSPEMKVLCNADMGTIRQEMAKLSDEVVSNANGFYLLYFAGHGAEINQKNYLFGPKVAFNPKKVAARLRSAPKAPLFLSSAVEITEDFTGEFGDYIPSNLLVIVDACRNDPFAYQRLSAEIPTPVTSPQPQGLIPGLVYLYATTSGQRVMETDTTYVADQLITEAQHNRSVIATLSAVVKNVSSKTRASNNWQLPQQVGTFNDVDLCFGTCGATTSSLWRPERSMGAVANMSRYALTQGSWGPRLHRLGTTSGSSAAKLSKVSVGDNLGVEPSQLPVTQKRPEVTIFDVKPSEKSQRPSTAVDVFWCDGDADSEGRELRAGDIARQLADASAADTLGLSISKLRVRRLDKTRNERAEFRISSDQIRIDSGDEVEFKLASKLSHLLRSEGSTSQFELVRVRVATPKYISLFTCEGVPPFEATARLWLQAPSEKQKQLAISMGQVVRSQFPDIWVADRVEVLASSPESTQIRYFFKEDASMAEEFAQTLQAVGVHSAEAIYLPQFQRRIEPGLMELWVGRSLTNDVGNEIILNAENLERKQREASPDHQFH